MTILRIYIFLLHYTIFLFRMNQNYLALTSGDFILHAKNSGAIGQQLEENSTLSKIYRQNSRIKNNEDVLKQKTGSNKWGTEP